MASTKVSTGTSTAVKVAVGVLLGAGAIALGYGFALTYRGTLSDILVKPLPGATTSSGSTAPATTTSPGILPVVKITPPAAATPKGSLLVIKQPLNSNMLANMDEDLMKFQIAASQDTVYGLAWKQIVFAVAKTDAISMSDFRLRRGAADMDLSVYAITDPETGTDLLTGSIPAGVNTRYVVVSLKPGHEEDISGSGLVYTLHATIAGAKSGQSEVIAFYRLPGELPVHGGLMNNTPSGTWSANANLYQLNPVPGATASALRDFLWSDRSGVPHDPGTTGGSTDWWNDAYITNLPAPEKLTLLK